MTGNGPCAITGQILPDFALPSRGGALIRVSDYRGRKCLVLVLAGDLAAPRSRQHLAELSRAYGDLQAAEAEVVVVVRVSRSELEARDLPYRFVILADEAGSVHQRFGCDITVSAVPPLVILTDRYGEICCTSREDAALACSLPPILGWLEFVNSLCPE
jgi:peroxiredoxin